MTEFTESSACLHDEYIYIYGAQYAGVTVDVVTKGGAVASVDEDKGTLIRVAREDDLAATKGGKVWTALMLLELSLAIQCMPSLNCHDLCLFCSQG